MENANINDWQEVPESPGTAMPQADPGDWQEQPRIPVDEITGEELPVPFSGLSPETARNKSIVSAMDRAKMSLGNLQGNISYLRQKYGDENVQLIPDKEGKPTEELAIMQDGTWYRVDAKNGDIPDAWEKTKEYVGDMADLASVFGAVGIGLGAARINPSLVLTPQGAAVTGAATAAIRTSLGRAVGTYEATPAQQIKDSAFEALLNAAGVKIAAGVKPTAKFMADKIDDLVVAFKDTLPGTYGAMKAGIQMADDAVAAVTETPKSVLKKILAGSSVGVQNFDTMLEHPEKVKAVMKTAWAKAGRSVEAYHDDITDMQIQQISNFADGARETLSAIYGTARNRILSKVSPNFTANFDDALIDSYREALKRGIGKIDFGDGTALRGADAIEWLNKHGLESLTKYTAKAGKAPANALPGQVGDIEMVKTGAAKLARFKLLSQAEMKASVRAGQDLADDIGYLATNKEAHRAVSQFYDDISGFARSANRSGVNAARDLLNFKRVAADKAYDLANSDHVASMPGVKRILDQARVSIDDSIYQSLKKAGPEVGQEFIQLNKTYSDLLKEMSPVMQVRNQAIKSGSQKPYEALLNRFLARPGKSVSEKFAIDSAIDAANAYGLPGIAEELASRKTAIQVGQAAKAFNPIPTGFTTGVNNAQAGLLMSSAAAAGLTGGNPLAVATMAGVGANMARQSPKLAAGAAAMYQVQQTLASMPKNVAIKAINDPKVTGAIVNGLTSVPELYDQTTNVLSAEAQRVLGGGQQ